jgi:transglutaminase-like putative cysteine protease
MQLISTLTMVTMICLSLRPLSAAAQVEERRASVLADYVRLGAGAPACSSGEANTTWFADLDISRKATGGRCHGVPTPPRPPTVDEKYSGLLDDVKEQAQRAKFHRKKGFAADVDVKALRAHQAELAVLEAEVDASFLATEQELKALKLPPVMLERHQAAVKAFKARQGQFKQLMQQLADADAGNDATARAAAVDRLVAFLEKNPQGPAQRRFDPDKLPFGAPVARERSPATTPAELPTAQLRKEGIRVSQPVEVDAQLAREALVAAPAAEDLAPTEDVQLTPEIQALAASLGNNPVRIYNWVRNNIRWLPTHGSIQGSHVTLLTKRGNAFDTSSLLIALYRAAGIPARYVYGTIEVPADQVMNWVGGVSRADAAQQLMGQGGIPNVALFGGGGIKSIRLEHVWVEAFVDFVPSRGSINKTPDTWVPVDASFKQYEYPAPVDLKASIPVDVQTAASEIVANAVIDPVVGSVTGLNQAAYDGWTQKMRQDINDRWPQPQLSDFTGRKDIIVREVSELASTLPNKVVTRTGSFPVLPHSLRHKVRLTAYSASAGLFGDLFSEPVLSYTVSLPAIAGKRLGVTYAPASAADAAALASYRASPGDSLPVYLFNVKPVIQLDGVAQAEGPASTMGQQQTWEVQLLNADGSIGHEYPYKATAGDEMVFGVNGNGITQELIHERFTRYPSDTAAENLQTVALYYWAQYDVLNEVVARARGVVVQRLPSIGLFSAPLQASYMFGVPRFGSYTSRFMDVSHSLLAAVEKANGPTAEYHRVTGTLGSLLEGRTFDGVFGRPMGSGVSSIQLLREANEQKIPIYVITAANYADIAPRLNLDASTESDIAQAIQAGKRVTVSERAPLHGNWSGVGYIVEDPESGAAAYLIKGALNGGADDPCNRERQREPVRVPVMEILFVIALILAILLLLIFLPEIIAAGAAAAGALGQAGPAFASLLLMLGLGASPAMAQPLQPGPGDSMSPPGDCSPAQHALLQGAVDSLCHSVPGCTGITDCVTLAANRQANLACALARTKVNTTCFRGGNIGHREGEINAYKAVFNCECRMLKQKCP